MRNTEGGLKKRERGQRVSSGFSHAMEHLIKREGRRFLMVHRTLSINTQRRTRVMVETMR